MFLFQGIFLNIIENERINNNIKNIQYYYYYANTTIDVLCYPAIEYLFIIYPITYVYLRYPINSLYIGNSEMSEKTRNQWQKYLTNINQQSSPSDG
jgi:hypothetical protein